MPSYTTNYNWAYPTDQADSGVWGGYLNQTIIAIDAQVKSNQNAIPSFTPVQQGGGTGQGTNKIYLGWTGTSVSIQVDSSNFGAIPTVSSPAGFYRGNGSTQTPTIYANSTAPSVSGNDGDLWFQFS